MNRKRVRLSALASVAAASMSVVCLQAQVAPATPGVGNAANETAVELSPFEVRASTDMGYQATETLAGSRMNTSLKDVATQLQIMTPEFLQDLAITDLNDATRYSLNNENYDEIVPLEAQNNTALRDTIGYGTNIARTRSLANSNATHDFFDTNIRIDSYNTERFTFASGPNSILFGNSGPGGTIDTSYKRALTSRRRFSIDLRADNHGSLRTVADLNQPLVKNMLALRLVNLRDRTKDWREPAFNNQDRYFASVVFTPFKKVSVRGYYERTFSRLQVAINTMMQDHVTPWIAAGKPTFDNGGTTFPALTAANNPNNVFVRDNATAARPFTFFNASGASLPANTVVNTVATQGFDGLLTAPNNFEHSILDGRVFPFDVSAAGNGNGSKLQAWIRGVIVEVNPVRNLFFELGVNQELLRQRGVSMFRGTDLDFRVDANRYVDLGGTTLRNVPNPNVGLYYFQTNSDANADARMTFSTRDQRRLSAAYDLNFTEHKGWTRWLGRHRFAALYEELTSVSATQNQDFRIVSDNSFIPAANGTALDNLNVAPRQPLFRYYLGPGETPWTKLPFDILGSGVQTLPGTDASGQPVRIAGMDSPFGAPSAANGSKKRQASNSFVMQNSFLKGRLVTTYGRRQDDVKLYTDDDTQTTQRIAGPTSGFVHLNQILASETGMSWTKLPLENSKPVTSVTGFVAHPFRWLSLSYSKADSQIVGTSLPWNLDGSKAAANSGEGRDYSITLRMPDDRLSIRFGKYETTAVGSPSAFRLNNPVGTITTSAGTVGNNIRSDLVSIERSIMAATGTTGASAKYQWLLDRIATLAPGQASTALPEFGQGNEGIAFNSDRASKGYEVTIVGNPTPRWRVSVGVARGETKETNIAPQWFDFIQERIPTWAKYLSTPLHNNATITIGDALTREVVNFNYILRASGKPQARERKYRANAVTRYSFERGWLKGANVGAAYMWRSPGVVGYPQMQVTDNPFDIPGVTPAGGAFTVDDQGHAYRGGALVTFDAFAGYGRKIWRDKILWRAQLNIRNALGETDPQVQRAMSTGEGAVYTIPASRTFILTNTFSF